MTDTHICEWNILGETLGEIQNIVDYLTKIVIRQKINIGQRTDGFHVTEVVYLLSNASWWFQL